MQPSNDNKMSTILLLCALGFLIYYLTSNDSTEEFDSVFFNKDNVPSKLINYEATETQMFPQQPKSLDYPANYKLGNDQANSMNHTIGHHSQPLQPLPQMPIPVREVPQHEAPHGATLLNPPCQPNVYSYDGFDSTGGSVASVGGAFDKLVDNNIATPDMVNLNKNEMKNFNNKDFLPKEVIPGAFDDFSQSKYNVDDDKLINTERYIIGINTVGQSLKNGSHDIRGTIANPKFSVSPWNNSTYEPDYNIKPLC